MVHPPAHSTRAPNSGGQTVTPKEDTASPSPTAVPTERGLTSSAMRVCCTPFQPMPTKPKTMARTASSQGLVSGPVPAMASEHAMEPSPARTRTMRRRPPKKRSDSSPKTTRPTMPVSWASTSTRAAVTRGIATTSRR